jgi:tripartite-type tricarboxylate transporter receptor subunit TctC
MATIVFAGGGEALKALLGDTVQISSGTLAPAHPYVKSGALTGLAVTGTARWQDLPEVPTMVEAGFKDFVFETYTALMAPAKTPPEIVSQLERTSLAILQRPEMREKLSQQAFEVQAKDGKGHMARIAKEVPMFREIITQAGIKQM